MSQIEVKVCGNGHAFVVADEVCEKCGAALQTTSDSARATVVARTVVRVNPSGNPFVLALARTTLGAQTLCIVDDDEVGDEVELYQSEGRYRVRARG